MGLFGRRKPSRERLISAAYDNIRGVLEVVLKGMLDHTDVNCSIPQQWKFEDINDDYTAVTLHVQLPELEPSLLEVRMVIDLKTMLYNAYAVREEGKEAGAIGMRAPMD